MSRGAESAIFLDNGKIVKDRIKKGYRIKELDDRLRGTRTRSEGSIIRKLNSKGFFVPEIFDSDKKQKITMQLIEGDRVRDVLKEFNYKKICSELGQKIRKLHDLGVIHGDLTTSNFIYSKKGVYFIDFGLSFYSHKLEDKAVDLHLLRQALESKHHKIWKKCFERVLKSYDDKDVEDRLEKVEGRGRHKTKKPYY